MNPGVGRRIITAAGFITTITGHGVPAVNTIGNAVGGVRRWSPSFHWISRLVMRFVGIRSRITTVIRGREIITEGVATIDRVGVMDGITMVEMIGDVIQATGVASQRFRPETLDRAIREHMPLTSVRPGAR